MRGQDWYREPPPPGARHWTSKSGEYWGHSWVSRKGGKVRIARVHLDENSTGVLARLNNARIREQRSKGEI